MTIERRVDFLGIPLKKTVFEPFRKEVIRDMTDKDRKKLRYASWGTYQDVIALDSNMLAFRKGRYCPGENEGEFICQFSNSQQKIYKKSEINESKDIISRRKFGKRVTYFWKPDAAKH